jgi:hypothetical protein
LQKQYNFLGYFFYGKSYVFILTKMGWATFWAKFLNKLIWSPWLERFQLVVREIGRPCSVHPAAPRPTFPIEAEVIINVVETAFECKL